MFQESEYSGLELGLKTKSVNLKIPGSVNLNEVFVILTGSFMTTIEI